MLIKVFFISIATLHRCSDGRNSRRAPKRRRATGAANLRATGRERQTARPIGLSSSTKPRPRIRSNVLINTCKTQCQS